MLLLSLKLYYDDIFFYSSVFLDVRDCLALYLFSLLRAYHRFALKPSLDRLGPRSSVPRHDGAPPEGPPTPARGPFTFWPRSGLFALGQLPAVLSGVPSLEPWLLSLG